MTVAADIEAFWSPEGRVAALAASLVAAAEALDLGDEAAAGRAAGTTAAGLDETLSSPDFDFAPVLAHLDQGGDALAVLLRQAGQPETSPLHDPALNDTSLMILCQDSLTRIDQALGEAVDRLLTLTEVHQLEATGLFLAQYLSAALQIQMVLAATRDALPVQVMARTRATAVIADRLALTVADLPWTEDRWPVLDQISGMISLSTLLAAFGVEVAGMRASLMETAAAGRGPEEVRAVADFYRAAGRGLDALVDRLDRWSAEPAEALSDGNLALVQGALARAREVLEAAEEA